MKTNFILKLLVDFLKIDIHISVPFPDFLAFILTFFSLGTFTSI